MKMKVGVIALFVIAMLSPPFKAQADSGGYIVKLKDIDAPAELSKILTEVNEEHKIYIADNIDELNAFSEYIEYTETNDEVLLIEGEPNIESYSLAEDELYPEQWQLQIINADSSWDIETYGNNVNIAIIDSGCNMHEDIVKNISGGYNFLMNNNDYSDNIGHGTHVTGLIAAEHNEIGIVGVAPKSNLYIMKCFDKYYSTTVTDLANAIYKAIDFYDCRIINMSLGLPADRQTLREAVEYAVSKDVIIVAAVGNDGTFEMYYPAGYDGVIGVGSVGINKEKSYFSETNESVFVVAPGEKAKSLVGTDEYDFKQGTSQSAPLVSGAIAVILSMKDDLTLEDVRQLITESSDDLGSTGYDTSYGYGLLNIQRLIDNLLIDIPYYISPINKDGVLILNNSKDVLNAVGIFSEYSGDVFNGMKQQEVILLPNKKVKINNLSQSNITKFFLWDSMEGLKPITQKRIGGVLK